jgi:hypothetical protein
VVLIVRTPHRSSNLIAPSLNRFKSSPSYPLRPRSSTPSHAKVFPAASHPLLGTQKTVYFT